MEQEFNLAQIRALLRRLWNNKGLFIIPGVIACAIATAIAIGQPDIYRGESMLIAEFSTPSGGGVRRSELDRTREILSQVSERVYAASFLTTLMDEIGLHPELRRGSSPERALAATREDLKVSLLGAKKIVTITYDYDKGENPNEKAAEAANYVAEYLVERARSSITDDSKALSVFYQKEADDAGVQVESRRNELNAFRTENDGRLPENRASNETRISRESQTINLIRIKEDSLQLEITDLEGDLELARRGLFEARVQSGADAELAPRRTELAALRSEYVRAERKYTAGSSQLKLMRERIEILEKEVAALEKSGLANASDSDPLVQYALNRITRVDSQRKRKIEELSNVDKIVAESRTAIAAAQARIQRSFELEPAYQNLIEAKEQAERRWNRARQELESAQLTLRFHSSATDFALHINERARASEKPVGPKRLFFALGGLLAGLGAGFGFALLRVRADTSCRSRADLKPLLPSAILVSIPNIESPTRRVWRVIRQFAVAGAILAVLACTIGALGLREGWWGDPATMDALIDGIKQRIGGL